MQIISHRGNVNGSSKLMENQPHNIMNTLCMGFDVEVDVWHMPDNIYLGHDKPQYKIEFSFLVNKHLWIHCKNIEAMVYLHLYGDENMNLFYHEEDIALTTRGYLWTAPGLLLSKKSIAVMPELAKGWDIKEAFGVCTDYPMKYK